MLINTGDDGRYRGEYLDKPAAGAIAVTPHDSTNLTNPTRGIYVGGDGNLTVVMVDGGVVLFTAAKAGSVLPIRVNRVNATGTSATGLVALY